MMSKSRNFVFMPHVVADFVRQCAFAVSVPRRYTNTMVFRVFRSTVCFFVVSLVGAIAALSAAEPKPLPQAHAHNDYEHSRPLFDALDHGFCSVEADIWLTPDGLLIGHDKKDLKPGRTLESLYLEPLRERVKANGGRVYKDGPAFYLLIDSKTEADSTYATLDNMLAKYADILTVTRDGKVEPKAVTVILSGFRAFDVIANQPVRYVGIDGRPENLDDKLPPELYPWISGNWQLFFKWKGDGPIPAAEKQKLEEMVKRAHEQGKKIRFWNTAEKPEMWKELLAAGVDYINTDKLNELQQFLVLQK
jgi:glycerophosphoryl diester phosphodiesterase